MKVKIGRKEFDCKVAISSWQKFKGLMLKRKIEPIIFIFEKEKQWPFHTFFMLKTIDMVFVNSEKKVVDIITAKPWKSSIKGKEPYSYIIEVAEGQANTFKIGSKISF